MIARIASLVKPKLAVSAFLACFVAFLSASSARAHNTTSSISTGGKARPAQLRSQRRVQTTSTSYQDGYSIIPNSNNKYKVEVTFPTCGPEVTLEWDCRKNRHDKLTFKGIEWPDIHPTGYVKRLDTDRLKPNGNKWGRCTYTMRDLKGNIAYSVKITKHRLNWQKPFTIKTAQYCPENTPPPTPKPVYAPTPACMAGWTGFTKVEKPDGLPTQMELTPLQNLQVGDYIVGLDENQEAVDDCEVVSVTTKGSGMVYGNYTNDHYVLYNESDALEIHGEAGYEGETTTVYQVLTSCPVVTDVTDQFTSFSICGKGLYDNGPMSWSDYLMIHRTMFNLVKTTGLSALSNLKSVNSASERLPTLCLSGLSCAKTGDCDDFENDLYNFVDTELVPAARDQVHVAFPQFGTPNVEGSISFMVSQGKSGNPGWYPVTSSATCKRDGNHPAYMEYNLWLFTDLESCCRKHFPWAFDTCMNEGEEFHTDKYFADFQSGSCLQDCEYGELGCASVPPPINLYSTVEECCDTQPWVDPVYCATRSYGISSYGWVVDHNNLKCGQDCDPDQGRPCLDLVHADYSLTIFATPEECCQRMLGWVNLDICVASSKGVPYFSDKFYVDWDSSKCGKDCDPVNGMPCTGNPQNLKATLYDSLELCCSNLSWLNANACIANTNGVAAQGSEEWYVDWVDIKCVKDCVGGPPCGGLKGTWEQGYLSASACCSRIPWVPADQCHL